jgi:universal stress protein A
MTKAFVVGWADLFAEMGKFHVAFSIMRLFNCESRKNLLLLINKEPSWGMLFAPDGCDISKWTGPKMMEASMRNMKKILAATDLSKLSRVGVRYAMEMALSEGAEVLVYHVINVGEGWFGGDEDLNPAGVLIPKQEQRLSEFVKEHCAEFLGKVNVQQSVELGVPYKRIVEKAETERANMIVMSTNGRTGLNHMMLGSVTEKVVARATPGAFNPAYREVTGGLFVAFRMFLHIPLKSPSIPKQTGSREVGAKRRWDFVHNLRVLLVASPLNHFLVFLIDSPFSSIL